ncbi:MAG: energy transducer TonB [Fibrobacter sp.]|nr:energy transducer TonB [Fibrobacter sp.]
MSKNQTGIFFLDLNQSSKPFPKEFNKGLFSRFETRFLTILILCGVIIFTSIGLLSLKKPSTMVSEKEISRIQERYARLVLNQPKPREEEKEKKTISSVQKTAEVKQEEKKEEVKVDREKETFVDKQKRKEAGSELRRQQRQEVAEQVKNAGIFAAITASGSGSGSIASASDLLSAGTQIEDLGNLNISKGTFTQKKSTPAGELKKRENRTSGVEIEKEKIGNAAVSQVASAATVNITSQPPEVTGESASHADRSQATIQRVVSRETQRLKRVYEDWLKRDPALSGRLSVKFVILPSGSVSNVSIVTSTTNNSDFDQTVLRYIKRWQFPVVEGGSPVEVVYPFVFEGQT